MFIKLMTSAAFAAIALASTTEIIEGVAALVSEAKPTGKKGRKGLWNIKYIHDRLNNAIPSNSQCSYS